jgi:hypothetical protein
LQSAKRDLKAHHLELLISRGNSMRSLREMFFGGHRTGKLASVVTAATAAACGQVELGKPFAPINAVSHITFGDEATRQDQASLKYTLTGALLNDSACVSWAMLHEQLFGRAAREKKWPLVVAGGGAVAALAYFTDYYLVPKRLTPGFEHRLSQRSLFLIYASMALALVAGSILNAKNSS